MRFVFVILDLYKVKSMFAMYSIPIVLFTLVVQCVSLNCVSAQYIIVHTECTMYTAVYIIHSAYFTTFK